MRKYAMRGFTQTEFISRVGNRESAATYRVLQLEYGQRTSKVEREDVDNGGVST